jgi:hypothetical protein
MRYKTLHAFGDSFVQGDQDDFLHDLQPGVVPNHNMNFLERVEYLRNNVSFASIIAKRLGYDYKNYAERGSGSYPQIDKLWNNLIDNTIIDGDIVLFGITTISRDRSSAHKFEESISSSYAERIADRTMLLTGAFKQLHEADYFYILSVLSQIETTFNIKIIKFNLFDNPLDDSKNHIHKLFNFNNFVGNGLIGNTLVDILNDTWGSNNRYPYHTALSIPDKFQHLYTVKKHPSINGHLKIAEWFLKNTNI